MKTVPTVTAERIMLSNREYARYSDGSLRRVIPKPNGKAEAKRQKRQRNCTNKVYR